MKRPHIKRLPSFLKHKWHSLRGFRSGKRAIVRRMKTDYNELRLGCAYSPAYPEICQVGRLLDEIQSQQSVKNWGR